MLSNCKCTLEGVAKEFVSIQIHHDVKGKSLELTYAGKLLDESGGKI